MAQIIFKEIIELYFREQLSVKRLFLVFYDSNSPGLMNINMLINVNKVYWRDDDYVVAQANIITLRYLQKQISPNMHSYKYGKNTSLYINKLYSPNSVGEILSPTFPLL